MFPCLLTLFLRVYDASHAPPLLPLGEATKRVLCNRIFIFMGGRHGLSFYVAIRISFFFPRGVQGHPCCTLMRITFLHFYFVSITLTFLLCNANTPRRMLSICVRGEALGTLWL